MSHTPWKAETSPSPCSAVASAKTSLSPSAPALGAPAKPSASSSPASWKGEMTLGLLAGVLTGRGPHSMSGKYPGSGGPKVQGCQGLYRNEDHRCLFRPSNGGTLFSDNASVIDAHPPPLTLRGGDPQGTIRPLNLCAET